MSARSNSCCQINGEIQMELGQLVERLSAKVEPHESECGRRYHDGCADAIREMLSMLYIPNDSETAQDPVATTLPS
jgi:hypothetical protein